MKTTEARIRPTSAEMSPVTVARQHIGDPHGDEATENDNSSVKRNEAGHDCAETQESGQIEDVGANHDARTQCTLVSRNRRYRSSNLGSVGGECRHNSEKGFGKAEPLAHPLQSGNEYPTRRETHYGTSDEGCKRESQDGLLLEQALCRPGFPALQNEH